jgi:hypothetical protein
MAHWPRENTFFPCQSERMQFANRWLLIAFASLSLGGCAATPKHVASAAEYDLACGRVSVSKIDSDHYAASGCGRGAVYTRTCDGGSCRWGRLRHGHEVEVANGYVPDPNAQNLPPREVLEAPAPEQRQVTPAPAPGQREVLPAPAPGADQKPAAASDGAAPADGSSIQGGAQGLVQQDNTQQLALSSGDLNNVQTQIPATQTVQRVQYAPPVALVETRPPQPYSNYTWIGGYWWWGSLGWTWVPGYWCPPYYGYSYIGGGWYWYNSWWWYYPGGWGYPGTRTVVYTPAPRTNVVTTTRTFHPHQGVMTGMGNSHIGAAPIRSIAPTQAFRPQHSPLLHPNNSAQAAQAFHGNTPSSAPHYFQPSTSARNWGTPSTSHSFVSPTQSHTYLNPSTTHSFVSPGRIVAPNQPSFPRSSYQTQAFHGSSSPSFHNSAPHYSAPPPHVNSSSSFRSSRPPPSSFGSGAFRGGGGGGFHSGGGGGGFHGGGGGGGFHGGHH